MRRLPPALALLALAAAEAFARAGGGESYSGSSSSYSYGGDSGDSAFLLIQFLILWVEFVVRHPLVASMIGVL